MSCINSVRTADMKMLNGIFKYSDTESIPLRFTYKGNVIHGIPASFSPKVSHRLVDANIVQYVIEGNDSEGLNIRAEYIEYRDYPVTEWVFYFTNTGNKDTGILENIRIEGILDCKSAVLEYGNGDTLNSDGYEFFKKPIDSVIKLTPTSGTSCQGAFPYMTLHGEDREIRAAIGWPTKWVAEISPAENGVTFSCGQDRCRTVLHPAETYRTPRLNLMVYANDNAPYRGINIWRHWYFDHIIPREFGKTIPPKLCLHYFQAEGKPEFTGASEKNQVYALNEYLRREMKPDIWWVDAGWYPCNYEWHSTGTWYPDPERFPRGLAPLGEACEKNDVQLLLWFEPERVRAGTELFENHPEWLLSYKDKDGKTGINYLLNYANSDALDWLIEHVDSIIKESHVAIYRQDFNFDPLPVWLENESENRIGMIENLHAQGYLCYWDELILRNPGLWIDSCASGGRRNDLESMRRAVTLHYTDVGYGNHPIKQKQHREMFEWIPYFRAHNMSWDNSDGSYGKANKDANEFDYHVALAPSLTSMCKYDDTEENFKIGRKMINIWRKAAELELSGDYYPMTECRLDAGDWYAMQFDNEKESNGFVQVIRNVLVEEDTYLVTLPCVHEDKIYTFYDLESKKEFKLNSNELKCGFEVMLPRRAGVVYFYNFE